MKNSILAMLARVVAGVAILLALLPVAAQAADTSTIETDLKAGGASFVATFPYAGDKSQLKITAVWSPADATNKALVPLDVYAPDPKTGKMVKIDGAGMNKVLGTKNALINTSVAGTYVVIVHNYDTLGRTIHVTLSTKYTKSGAAGPALTVVTSEAPAVASAAAATTAAPATVDVAASVASSKIETDLKAGGASFVATFPYAGDKSQLKITAVWSPADATNKALVPLDVYAPDPKTGKMVKIDGAGMNKVLGTKNALINTSVAGTYVVIVHNYDTLGRTIHVTLSTKYTKSGADGPALTVVK